MAVILARLYNVMAQNTTTIREKIKQNSEIFFCCCCCYCCRDFYCALQHFWLVAWLEGWRRERERVCREQLVIPCLLIAVPVSVCMCAHLWEMLYKHGWAIRCAGPRDGIRRSQSANSSSTIFLALLSSSSSYSPSYFFFFFTLVSLLLVLFMLPQHRDSFTLLLLSSTRERKRRLCVCALVPPVAKSNDMAVK